MIVVAAVVGYLLGSFICGSARDVRPRTPARSTSARVGTGNPGALNAMRSVGRAWGIVVMVLDVVKGIVARLIGGGSPGTMVHTLPRPASIAGHIFPVWVALPGGRVWRRPPALAWQVFPLYFPLNAVVAYLTAVRSQRATIGTQVGCAIWIGAAVLWTVFDWPNLWGPPTGLGLIGFSVVGSMILWAFWHGNRELARRAAVPGPKGRRHEGSSDP